MGRYDREYQAFQIFEQVREEETKKPSLPAGKTPEESLSMEGEELFYEIEYDSCPLPGVGKYVLKSRKIEPPKRDEIRKIFDRMRDIARESRTYFRGSSRFYDGRIRRENSEIFYKQGVFMKDFEDDWSGAAAFSAYFPDYQSMGYDQLRTYFTWRSRVRRGEVQSTSLSYAFVYIYELLNQIGVEGPEEGLERLLDFWSVFRVYDRTLDRYMIRWLKDYHIYYELPWSFREFLEENHLEAHYPDISDPGDDFRIFSAVSKYDIRRSKFYTEDRKELIRDCFNFVMEGFRQALCEKGFDLDGLVFRPARGMPPWTPFKDALFCPGAVQRDRQVVLSGREIYMCSGGSWTFSAGILTESGRGLIGYLMKQTEAVLRKAVQYKYKLTAGTGMISEGLMEEFRAAGIDPERIVEERVQAFYRELTRTVVSVDKRRLDQIRQEALRTQEKLIVPEEGLCTQEKLIVPEEGLCTREKPVVPEEGLCTREKLIAPEEEGFRNNKLTNGVSEGQKKQLSCSADPFYMEERAGEEADMGQNGSASADGNSEKRDAKASEGEPGEENAGESSDPWEALKGALSGAEKQALSLLLEGKGDLKRFADEQGIMLEVLAEKINEKAMDCVGDGLLDEEFAVYEDYADQIREIIQSDNTGNGV